MAIKTDDSAVVTRKILMEELGVLYERVSGDIHSATSALEVRFMTAMEKQISASEERLMAHMTASEKRTKEYFDVVAENYHRNAMDMYGDRIGGLENRVTRLEQHTRLPA